MINRTKDKVTMEIEAKIGRRAVNKAWEYGIKYELMTAIMDIDACHNNGCPLELTELLNADDFNFAHDVFGIREHIDRKTGKLMDCFLPRYAE